MEFENKRSLLEYLGKNPKDNKLVDRMMLRWEVYMENGMYYLVEEDVDVLRRENEELKRKLEEKSEQPNAKNFEDTAEIIKLRGRIAELEEQLNAVKKVRDIGWEKEGYVKISSLLSKDLYDHLKYFYDKYVDYKQFVWRKVWGMKEYVNNRDGTQKTEDDVRAEVYEKYNFSFNDIDKAECEFVEDLVNQMEEKIRNGTALPF